MAPIYKVNLTEEQAEGFGKLGFELTREEISRKDEKSTDLVVPVQDFWTIPNVHYRGETGSWDLLNHLLNKGRAHTQAEWASMRREAEPKGEFYTGDLPLHMAVFHALYEQRNELEFAGEARDFLRDSMGSRGLMTLSRFSYTPKRKKDIVTHNYETDNSYQIKAHLVGQDRVIQEEDSGALFAGFGIGDAKKINKVFNWINRTDLYIVRVNEKPQELTECVAMLNADPDIAYADCNGHPDYAFASLGVRIHARSASKK